jgi:hypothetical protein
MTTKDDYNHDPRIVIHTSKYQNGQNPRGFIEALASIIEHDLWCSLHDANGNKFESFEDFITTPYPEGCGWTVERVEGLLHVMIDGEETSLEAREKWNKKRAVIADALGIEHSYGVMLAKHGEIGNGRSRDSESESLKVNLGANTDYTVARLEREARDTGKTVYADLADAVRSKRVSAAEARRRAGWETKDDQPTRRSVRMDDAESAASTIIKYMPLEVRLELARRLLETDT